MTSGLLLAMISGGFIGLGIYMFFVWMLPVHVDLADALARLSPTRVQQNQHQDEATSTTERLGLWAIRVLPPGIWVRTPIRELALLRISLARFYGEKLLFALLGLTIPPLLTVFFGVIGIELPWTIPIVASIGLAVLMFFLPNYNAVDDAKKARLEFTRALGAYIEMVALERNTGSGVRQSMEAAANVCTSWVFTRLSEELTRSRWSGLPPWDALHALGVELGLPELDDFADIMRLSGEEGASVYATLRARSNAMRTAMLNDELTEANATGERMSIPSSLLGVVFMGLLLAPALLRMVMPT
ncbi:type II secretion system F family protein [Nocardioides sp. NPDC057772]|uniref:type II secretion system F family protein n=1 Tax=unclassified Nocardioides TaxID=2615069 RepID=UPI0002028B51|nr:type II secretion system F family protein [Nocardioides sp. NBC_00368]EGD42797.1 putative integral membrane protein [Nocardioidaceae bacterium Broad-1]